MHEKPCHGELEPSRWFWGSSLPTCTSLSLGCWGPGNPTESLPGPASRILRISEEGSSSQSNNTSARHACPSQALAGGPHNQGPGQREARQVQGPKGRGLRSPLLLFPHPPPHCCFHSVLCGEGGKPGPELKQKTRPDGPFLPRQGKGLCRRMGIPEHHLSLRSPQAPSATITPSPSPENAVKITHHSLKTNPCPVAWTITGSR